MRRWSDGPSRIKHHNLGKRHFIIIQMSSISSIGLNENVLDGAAFTQDKTEFSMELKGSDESIQFKQDLPTGASRFYGSGFGASGDVPRAAATEHRGPG